MLYANQIPLPMPDQRDLAAPLISQTSEVRRKEATRKCPVHGSIEVPDCPYCESHNR